MNASQFRAKYSGLTTVAKKVYEAVPIDDEWTAAAIHSELTRTGSHRARHITDGCLKSLVECGVVSERERGLFRRIKVSGKASSAETDSVEYFAAPPQQEKKEVAETKPFNAMERLTTIADNAIKIAASMKALASDIETAAIEIADQANQQREDSAKLRQLQQLLKSIG